MITKYLIEGGFIEVFFEKETETIEVVEKINGEKETLFLLSRKIVEINSILELFPRVLLNDEVYKIQDKDITLSKILVEIVHKVNRKCLTFQISVIERAIYSWEVKFGIQCNAILINSNKFSLFRDKVKLDSVRANSILSYKGCLVYFTSCNNDLDTLEISKDDYKVGLVG